MESTTPRTAYKPKTAPKLLVAAVLLVMLVAFNIGGRPYKTIAQAEFDGWMLSRQVELHGDKEIPAEKLPAIAMHIRNDAVLGTIDWSLSARNDPAAAEKIVRLLDLVETAEMFSLPQAPSDSGSALISIEVIDQQKTFKTQFLKSAIENNTQAELLLKLFQVYALTSPQATLQSNLAQGVQSPAAKDNNG